MSHALCRVCFLVSICLITRSAYPEAHKAVKEAPVISALDPSLAPVLRGYSDWTVVSVSQTDDLLGVILANPTMIAAYRASAGRATTYPIGSAVAKIHWKMKKSSEAPTVTLVPDVLADIDFMIKFPTEFSDTGGWGYYQVNHNAAANSFSPEASGHACGFGCHSIAAKKDFIFTTYQQR